MRLVAFVSFLVLVLVVWIGGWFAVAAWLESQLVRQQERFAEKGQHFECANQEITGFPFRFGLSCDQTHFYSDLSRLSADAGALRSAAQFYQPGKAILEIDAPSTVSLPNGGKFTLDWKSARASINAGLGGPKTLSSQIRELKITPEGSASALASAPDTQIHWRRSGENDMDVAASATALKLAKSNDPFSINADIHLNDSFHQLIRERSLLRLALTEGLKGSINSFSLATTNDAKISISGPFEINQRGQLSGKFALSVENLQAIGHLAARLYPRAEPLILDLTNNLGLISGTGTEKFDVALDVSKGRIFLGFIPVGEIPPLF